MGNPYVNITYFFCFIFYQDSVLYLFLDLLLFFYIYGVPGIWRLLVVVLVVLGLGIASNPCASNPCIEVIALQRLMMLEGVSWRGSWWCEMDTELGILVFVSMVVLDGGEWVGVSGRVSGDR